MFSSIDIFNIISLFTRSGGSFPNSGLFWRGDYAVFKFMAERFFLIIGQFSYAYIKMLKKAKNIYKKISSTFRIATYNYANYHFTTAASRENILTCSSHRPVETLILKKHWHLYRKNGLKTRILKLHIFLVLRFFAHSPWKKSAIWVVKNYPRNYKLQINENQDFYKIAIFG